MGATRLASEKMQLLFSRVRFTLLSLSLSVPTRDEAAEKCPDAGQGKLL